MPKLPRSRFTRPRITTTTTTSAASCCTSDDEDAITPCSSPPPEPQLPVDEKQPRIHESSTFTTTTAPPSRNGSLRPSSTRMGGGGLGCHFDPAEGEDLDDERLWRRMLAIQRIFHCYNSARMSAALLELEKGEDVGRFMPSRGCLDLLNDSIELGDEIKRQVSEWLHNNNDGGGSRYQRRMRSHSWRRSFHVAHATTF